MSKGKTGWCTGSWEQEEWEEPGKDVQMGRGESKPQWEWELKTGPKCLCLYTSLGYRLEIQSKPINRCLLPGTMIGNLCVRERKGQNRCLYTSLVLLYTWEQWWTCSCVVLMVLVRLGNEEARIMRSGFGVEVRQIAKEEWIGQTSCHDTATLNLAT